MGNSFYSAIHWEYGERLVHLAWAVWILTEDILH